jgi:hypothetical protein
VKKTDDDEAKWRRRSNNNRDLAETKIKTLVGKNEDRERKEESHIFMIVCEHEYMF